MEATICDESTSVLKCLLAIPLAQKISLAYVRKISQLLSDISQPQDRCPYQPADWPAGWVNEQA